MRALRLIREVRGAWRQNLKVREITKLSDSPCQELAPSPIHLWAHHPKRQALRCRVSHGPEHAPYCASPSSVLSVCRKCDSKNLSLVETRRESSERIAMDQGKVSSPGFDFQSAVQIAIPLLVLPKVPTNQRAAFVVHLKALAEMSPKRRAAILTLTTTEP